jgi:hypothetical protein
VVVDGDGRERGRLVEDAVDDGVALPWAVDLGPAAEAADGLDRQLAAAFDVRGVSGIGRDRGQPDERAEEPLEAGPLALGEREETGPF